MAWSYLTPLLGVCHQSIGLTPLLKLQSRSKESCNASRLREYHPRAIMALYAMVSESSAPLDLVVTDGITFDLFRFREDKRVLIYHDLSGTEVNVE